MLLGHGEHHVGVELREQHEPGAHRHREGEAQRESVGVEHRQDGVDDAAFAAADRGHPRARLLDVREQVAMRERRALRCARRAARVLDDREIVGGRLGVGGRKRRRSGHLLPGDRTADARGESLPRLPRLGDRQAQGEPRQEGHGLGDVDGDEGRDLQIGRELLHGRDDLAPHDGVLGAVVLELLAQLTRGVERVVLDDDGAEPQDRVEGDDVLRAVRQDDRDRVAGPHPARLEAGGGAVDRLLHLAVARLAAEELQRGRIRVVAHRRRDDVEERSRHGFEVVRHAFGIAGDPWARRIIVVVTATA